MHRRFRGGAAVLAVALVGPCLLAQPAVAAGAVTAGSVAAGSVAAGSLSAGSGTTTTTPAGPTTWATVHAEQVQVVTRDEQAGVDQATAALTRDTATLDQAAAALTSDTGKAAAAATAAADAAQAQASVTGLHDQAVTAHQDAITSLATDRARLAQVGIALYMGPPPEVPDLQADVTGVQASADGAFYLDESQQEVTALVRADRLAVTHTQVAEARLATQVGTDTGVLDRADQASRSAKNTVATDELALTADKSTTATDQKAVTAAQSTMTAALAAMGSPAPDGSPTIIGTPTLLPAQLAGWFATSYYQDQTTSPIAQLAAFYVDEGRAEAVRGDLAFAQAILETGGFSSPDAVNLSNFAGVGHCDSCGTGLAFPNPEGGVEGQIQLLRIFGSAPGTKLVQPAIIPQVGGTQSAAGCCVSWQSLTGHWASDPDYGQKIMALYQQMLAYALSQPALDPTSAAAGFAAASATPSTTTTTTVAP